MSSGPSALRIAACLVALTVAPAAAAPRATGAAWIGVELGRGPTGGVAIRRVLDGAPAERAHLMAGDEVLAIDGASVRAPDELARAVRGRAVGETVRLRIAGTPPREVQVTLETRPAAADYQRHALLDKPAPDFTPAVQAGPPVPRLSSLRGQVVLLDFFATWCLPCMAALPRLQALQRELGPRGLRVVGVSGEEPATVAALARERGLAYSVASDGGEDIASRYHVSALPTMVVVDRAGVVRQVAIADLGAAERRVRQLLDGPREP